MYPCQNRFGSDPLRLPPHDSRVKGGSVLLSPVWTSFIHCSPRFLPAHQARTACLTCFHTAKRSKSTTARRSKGGAGPPHVAAGGGGSTGVKNIYGLAMSPGGRVGHRGPEWGERLRREAWVRICGGHIVRASVVCGKPSCGSQAPTARKNLPVRSRRTSGIGILLNCERCGGALLKRLKGCTPDLRSELRDAARLIPCCRAQQPGRLHPEISRKLPLCRGRGDRQFSVEPVSLS